jgi:cytochrome c biogenesis protein ResB
VNALYRFLKSVRLAVVLILVITFLSLLSTLVPQGRPDPWYRERYPRALSSLIRLVSFDRFFTSAIFLVPVLLFTANLGVCAADRLIARERNKAKRRHGPDLIHIGILVLIAGGLVTTLGRQEKTWPLAAGEDAAISPTYSLHLDSFQSLKYDNGSPREWISTVSVTRDGKQEIASFPIEVNRPLRLQGISVYQASWETEGILELETKGGKRVNASTGQGFQDGDSFWYFSDARQDRLGWMAVFQEYKGDRLVSARTLGAGERIGPFTVVAVSARELTGLKVVKDPGRWPFLAALILILSGLCLTFFQKRREAAA